ncbi:MAG: VOC family protein [Pseudohongiellaceae bacterium]
MTNPVIWFEIYVQDMPRALKFYQGVFQIKLTNMQAPEGEMWGFPSDMNEHGSSGTLIKAGGVPSGGNSCLVYFYCPDCAVEEARVTQFGGKVQRRKMSIGQYGFVSLILDTEGNMIGLHSLK